MISNALNRDNAQNNSIACDPSHGQAESLLVRLRHSNSSAAVHGVSLSTTCPYRSRRDLNPSDKLQELYVWDLLKELRIRLISILSTRRPVPIHPQDLPLRWRRIPPGTTTPPAVLPLSGPSQIPSIYRALLHTTGLAQCTSAHTNC